MMGTGYTAFVLDDESRRFLLEVFPPKYGDVIAHHITHKFGATEDDVPQQPQQAKVIGYHDSGAIQVLTVEIDGERRQESQETRFYHITHSLDRTQGKTPRDSNDVLQAVVAKKGEAGLRNLPEPILITVTPQFLTHADKPAKGYKKPPQFKR